MLRHCWLLALLSVVGLCGVTANAEKFVNPPESASWVPAGGWVTPWPYQRNVLIDFATDPSTWPTDPVRGKDLQPGVNVDLEGTMDPSWHDSDWGDAAGDGFVWLGRDPGGSGRTGLLGIQNLTNPNTYFTIHLDNSPTPNTVKHVWMEVEYYSNGLAEWYIAPDLPTGYSFYDFRDNNVSLGNGWVRRNIWLDLRPNPPWEELRFQFYGNPTAGGTVLIDSFHVATECVPEPATVSLFGAAALWTLRRRRQ